MILAGFFTRFSDSLSAIRHFFATGGWFMVPIVLCSLIMVAVVIAKWRLLQRDKIIPPGLEGWLRDHESAVWPDIVAQDTSPLGAICRDSFVPHTDLASAVRTAETSARLHIMRMERGLSTLEIIFTIAPMLGLIGTAGGLVQIFAALGDGAETADRAAKMAAGISEAMNTTIAGLIVAVPALIAYVLFSRRVEHLATEMASLINGALNRLWNSRA